MKSPYFTMRVGLSHCAGMYQLNGNILELGVPMEVQMQAPVDVKVPVNHWIQPGKNEMLMALFPTEDTGFAPDTTCRMTLRVADADAPGGETHDVATLEFSAKDMAEHTGFEGNAGAARLSSAGDYTPQAQGDVVVEEAQPEQGGDGFAVARRRITLPELDFAHWKYLDSEPITGLQGVDLSGQIDDETRARLTAELLPIYREIWQALKKRDVKRILPLFDERNRETDAAMWKPAGATAKQLELALSTAAADKHMKLWPITDDNVQVDLHDNDHLVRLMQNNREPLISFDIAGGGSQSFDIVFRKSGKKWIIAR